jgi:hypothetical protein
LRINQLDGFLQRPVGSAAAVYRNQNAFVHDNLPLISQS